ncbi:MAG TPA: Gfo/Idh/MocA family oxidoreductase, partial [Pseudonocardia sp.]|nr:Gfo/Idh/MocA family oxidoreductase [Pseudonocardia sp.]
MPDGSRQYRVAIVGAGGIAGHRHMPAIRAQNGRIEVVAAVDVDGDRAAAFAAEWGIPESYTDLDAMLAGARPDLVIICTPP